MGLPIQLADIQEAADAIRDLVTLTPVQTCGSIDAVAGRHLVFKCEVFQKTGAFKYRGACNAVRQLSTEQRAKGVVTHSSGALAAARASGRAHCERQLMHTRAHRQPCSCPGAGHPQPGHPCLHCAPCTAELVLLLGGQAPTAATACRCAQTLPHRCASQPKRLWPACSRAWSTLADLKLQTGPAAHHAGVCARCTHPASGTDGSPGRAAQCKVDAVRAYGGQLTFCEATMGAREAACQQIQARTGAAFIPPFNHTHVMAGQGTLGLELVAQTGGALDAVVVPISGGGMISGVATAVKGLHPGILVLAAEPRGECAPLADLLALPACLPAHARCAQACCTAWAPAAGTPATELGARRMLQPLDRGRRRRQAMQ